MPYKGIPIGVMDDRFVNIVGDTMTGTLEIDVATATDEALILKTTDDNATKNLFETQDSGGTASSVFTSAGNLNLPSTSSTIGQILQNGVIIYQSYGTNNLFLANSTAAAGNFTLTGARNVGIGGYTLDALTSGNDNVGIGGVALSALTTGSNNLGLGSSALSLTTTGNGNVGVGTNSLRDNVDGARNIGIGASALQSNTSGSDNVGAGNSALVGNTTGINNLAFGTNSLANNDGNANIGIGNTTLNENTSGGQNVGMGLNANRYNQEGSGNVAIGHDAGKGTSTHNKQRNVIVGYQAGSLAQDANNNILIGYKAGNVITTGDDNIIIGYDIDPSGATVSNELNIGGYITGTIDDGTLIITSQNAATIPFTVKGAASQSANLQEWQDSSGNVLGGVEARGTYYCDLNTDSTNLFIGAGAGKIGATGTYNVAFGANALESLTSGNENVAIGRWALQNCTEGSENFALGSAALRDLTTGTENIAIGRISLDDCTTGYQNVAIGESVLRNVTEGFQNVAIGQNALEALATGYQNIAIGVQAGFRLNGAEYRNILIGVSSFEDSTDGNNNVAIGYQTGQYNIDGDDNLFLGYQAGRFETGSQMLYIANGATYPPLIYGEFDNELVRIHGDLTLADADTLGAEVLNETGFDTHAKWDVVGDFDDTAGTYAVYINSGGSGTLTQTSANMATPLVGNTWYALTYTCYGYTNSSFTAHTLTTGILDTALTIPIRNGTYTIAIYTKATPGDFVISITSDGTCDVFFDDISLKPITGGDLTVLGTCHFGDAANYSQFANDGTQTMVGTAKAYKESTFTFNYARVSGQGKPDLVNQGVFFGFSLPLYAEDEELFACKCMNSDWDGTTDPIIYLGGWLDTANNTKKFNLQVSVETADYSSNDVVPVTSNDIEVETTTGNWAQYTSFKVPFTVDASDIGLASGQPIAIRVRRIAATANEIAGEVVIEGAVLVYVANKIGGTT